MIEILLFVVGCFVGWHWRGLLAKVYLRRLYKKVEQAQAEEEAAIKRVPIDIHRNGDTFYIYERDTGQFLVQGKDLNKLESYLSETFPTTVFLATAKNVEDVGYVK